MPHLLYYLALAGVCIALGVVAFRQKYSLQRKADELNAMEGEEQRMFAFLHDLGSAIDSSTTTNSLYRLIVEGVNKVVTARAGALYLLDESQQRLQPKYLSVGCPALITVPAEVIERAGDDANILLSFLRLEQVSSHTGIFGEVLRSGDSLSVEQLHQHPAFQECDPQGAGQMAAMIAPLRHAGKDLGVLALTRPSGEGAFTANDFAVFRTVAEQSAFAIGNARVHKEASEKRQIEGELRTAREVQRVLLPQGEPVVPGYRICGTNTAARIISGDYYDFLSLGPNGHGVVIADVSGKGVAAGLLMAMCRSVLRYVAPQYANPAVTLSIVNRLLFPDIREDMFISLFYAVIPDDGGRIQLARAGHDAALLYRSATKEIQIVKPPGLALGIDDGDVFERVTKIHEIELQSGDCLLFYTDGVREAVDSSSDEFGLERLQQAFGHGALLGAEAAIRSVEKELAAFLGDVMQMDDVTLVAIEKR